MFKVKGRLLIFLSHLQLLLVLHEASLPTFVHQKWFTFLGYPLLKMNEMASSDSTTYHCERTQLEEIGALLPRPQSICWTFFIRTTCILLG